MSLITGCTGNRCVVFILDVTKRFEQGKVNDQHICFGNVQVSLFDGLWFKKKERKDCGPVTHGCNFVWMELHLTAFVFSSPGIESSLESQADMESSGQQSDDASLPSTSQDPGNLFC